jgi:hypothetical protein
MKKIKTHNAFYLTLLLAALIMDGCMTARNLPKHNDKYPLEASRYAADHWPCKDSLSIDSVTVIDSFYLQPVFVDTVIQCDSPGVKNIIVPCPPAKVITEEKTKTIYVVRLDNARLDSLRLALQKEIQVKKETEARLQQTKDKLNWWKIACLITWGFIALVLGWKARKLFP